VIVRWQPRRMGGLAFFLTLTLTLAACGAVSTTPEASADATEAPSSESAEGSQPAESAAAEQGGTLRIGTATDLLTLDLPNYVSSQDLQVGDLIFDTLVGYTPDLELVPRLAESWDQPDDSTYVFNLRPDVVFTDGNPVNAEAVKAHFDRARADQRQSHYLSAIESVEATDASHFKVISGFGVGSIKVRFAMEVDLFDIVPGRSARMRVRGKAPGSALDVLSSLEIQDAGPDKVRLNWSATSEISGTVAGVGARLMEGTARKLTELFWTDFALRVSRE